MLFSLLASLGGDLEEDARKVLNEVCAPPALERSFFGSEFGMFGYGSTTTKNTDTPRRLFVASVSELLLSVDVRQIAVAGFPQRKAQAAMAAIFVPPTIVENVFQKHTSDTQSHAHGSSFWLDEESTRRVCDDLLSGIHPDLRSCCIRGIILTTIASEFCATAEIVLIDLVASKLTFNDLAQSTNGQHMVGSSHSIIKVLPVAEMQFCSNEQIQRKFSETRQPCLPTCPVCLHRIDTARLGLPTPRNRDLCSKFCPSPGILHRNPASDSRDYCPRQRLLKRWPAPSRCMPCSIIDRYWQQSERESDSSDIFCGECAMHKTLWVCLTCGFVGCGRYTNKHSVAHFQQTGHPYSLELATLRIWDYEDGEAGGYAHRTDLLECPSSPPLASPWVTDYGPTSSAIAAAACPDHAGMDSMRPGQQMNDGTEKSPKKAIMIGEEYEALLQSALEDQAQYFEGEMARLQAEFSASLAEEEAVTEEEADEIDQLNEEITRLRQDLENASRDLLDIQAEEAENRNKSQRLLREQQVANDVLSKLRDETRAETERGRMQVRELEQQIADLTANLRMRKQFSNNEELSKAQIFGTNGTSSRPSSASKRGKKKGRNARK